MVRFLPLHFFHNFNTQQIQTPSNGVGALRAQLQSAVLSGAVDSVFEHWAMFVE
jgi:hypothetical protein